MEKTYDVVVVGAEIVGLATAHHTLRPEPRHLCRGLIYPAAGPELPFLGAHITKRCDGTVWAGPDAVRATAPEGYGASDLDLQDLTEKVRYPWFARLARRWRKTGAQKVWRDVVQAVASLTVAKRLVDEVDRGFWPTGSAGSRTMTQTIRRS